MPDLKSAWENICMSRCLE